MYGAPEGLLLSLRPWRYQLLHGLLEGRLDPPRRGTPGPPVRGSRGEAHFAEQSEARNEEDFIVVHFLGMGSVGALGKARWSVKTPRAQH